MRMAWWLGFLGCTALVAGERLGLPLEFDREVGWEARPAYLPNACAAPEVGLAEGVVSLAVTEPGKGMKFELPLRPVRSAAVPYLALRYRARNLAGGYALWVYDGSQGGRQLAGVGELLQDTQWHTLAVDLVGSGVQGRVTALLTEVQCARAPALLEIDWIRAVPQPPEGAQVIAGVAKPVPDLSLAPEVWRQASARPGWLGEPAPVQEASVTPEKTLRLRVDGAAGQGMKWAVPLPQPIALADYRYVVLWYRGRNLQPHGDYLLWLGSAPGGAPPESQAAMRLTEALGDGEWHLRIVPMVQRFTVQELALHVRTLGGPAELEIRGLTFCQRPPRFPLRDLLPEACTWRAAGLEGADWQPVDLAAVANVRADTVAGVFGVEGWLPAGQSAVRGVPFALPAGERTAVQLEGLGEVAVPVPATAGELYLLMGCDPTELDYARMGDPVPLDAFSQAERFRLRLEYEDGVRLEAFPVRVSTGAYEVIRGVEVYALPDLRRVPLARLVLVNRMESGLVLLAGVTANRGQARVASPAPVVLPPAVEAITAYGGSATIRHEPWGFALVNDLVRVEIGVTAGMTLHGLWNGCLFEGTTEVAAGPLFEVGAGGTTVSSDRLTLGPAVVSHDGDVWRLVIPVDAAPAGVPLQGQFTATVGDGDGVRLALQLSNRSTEAITPRVRFPLIRNLRLGPAADTWYLYANRGGIISNRPAVLRAAYGGEYPLQVMSAFSPKGGAVALFTEDTQDTYRFWELTKGDQGVDLSLDAWSGEVAPGQAVEVVPVVLRTHPGDWRQSLRLYREWAQSWYQPQVPRKDWFQRAFYYQQTNAWTRLRDPATGAWRVADEVRAYREAFGCLDYLHIFDFGESRTYGRVGDYSHYDELGGLEALRSAIQEIRAAGVPVGLYLEGYLCDERGVWGRDHVGAEDIRQQDGTPLLWPGTPTEHMMCPASTVWREHIAATEKRVAAELQPDGLYTDQYGFINTWKTCWSRQHGHPVPYPPIRGERDTTRAIREAVPATVATLTEDVPNDLHTQYQDGALAYSVTFANGDLSPHRVHLLRFMFPDFKTFQLVQYNPFTEGAWHLLKYPFFNGEGFWLHGSVPAGYCEDARQFLKEAFRVLNQYEEAFASPDVEPLVPTLWPAVYANRFGRGDLRVWTLLNADSRTYRGPVLRVPNRRGVRYRDAFTGEPATIEEAGGAVILHAELGPQGVGCLVGRRE